MSVATPPVEQAAQETPSPSKRSYGDPWVAIGAGTVAAVGAAAVAVLGLTTVCAALAGTTGVLSAGLLVMRWKSLKQVDNPAGSARFLVVLLIVLAGLALAAPVLIRVFDHHLAVDRNHHRLWPLRGIAITVTAAAAVTHLSAMIDWAFINLRLKGVLGDWTMPCQRSSKWKLYTRMWLAHRVAANLVGRLAIATVIGFAAALIIHIPSVGTKSANGTTTIDGKTLAAIVVPLGATLLVFFLNRFLPVWSLVLNPRLSVGDHIVLAEEYGTGVERRPHYYVVDVANEGAKLLELKDGKPRGGPAAPGKREHDRSLDLVDIPRLLRRQRRYQGCLGTCSMANHHCPVGLGLPVAHEPLVTDGRRSGQPGRGR